MTKKDFLTKKECIYVLELINSAILCNTEHEFRMLINGLRSLLPIEYAICGMSRLGPEGKISSFEIFNINYPSQWLEQYLRCRYDKIDPIVSENYRSFKLQYWSDTYQKLKPCSEFVSTAEDFDLKDGYTLGFRDFKSNMGSIFTVAGPKIPKSARSEFFLNALVPHFHQSLLRLTSKAKNDKQEAPLSMREVEVFNWLKYGKTSWEISKILNISERTVNFHCATVMHKLNAVSRSHALAIVIDNGLISLD